MAEGTKEVSPTSTQVASLYYSPVNYGSYFNCPVDNRINFVISDHNTENLYFGFRWVTRGNATLVNNMYYRILNSSGVVIVGPTLCPTAGNGLIGSYNQAVAGPNIAGSAPTGYSPISFNPTANDTYYIELYRSSNGGVSMNVNNAAIAPFFDFTVATTTGTRSLGRVFAKKWGFVAGNPGDNYTGATTDNVSPEFYTYTADSTIVNVVFDRFNPLAFNVAFNSYGVDPLQTDVEIGRRSVYSANNPDLSGSYNTFLNTPDVTIFPTSPAPLAPTVGTLYGCPGFYYLPYRTYASGDIRLLLDLNGVPGYQENTADLYLFAYEVPKGLNTITWNGLDGLGAQVAVNSSVNVQLTSLRGRTNMPLYDPEYNLYGFTLNAIAPTPAANLKMYWDDSFLAVISGQSANNNNSTGAGIANVNSGQVSPGHAWNGNYGGTLITTFPAPSIGATGNATVGNLDDDFGNVRIMNTWFWPVEVSGASTGLTIPNCTPEPDINITYVNVQVDGSVSANDDIAVGSTYGTPTAVPGNPGPAVPTLNSSGFYSFTSAVAGVFQFDVPVCAPTQVAPCPNVLLTITVLDNSVVINPPVANTDIATTNMEVPVTLNTLANDHVGNLSGSLVPGTVTITSGPSNGIAVINTTTGEITYTPATGFTGYDTLTYTICDNSTPTPLCATALQIITVQGVCDCTINSVTATDDYSYTPFNTPVNGNAMLNDTDPEGDALTITGQTTNEPGVGTLVLNTDGTYTFTPVTGFTGPWDFYYTNCDNGTPQACTQATIHILVAPPLFDPNPDFNVTYVNVTVTGNVSTNDNVEVGSTYGTPTAVPGNPGPAIPVMNADGTYSFTSAVAGVFVFDVPVCVPAQVAPCPPVLLTITVLDNSVVINPPVANVDIASTLLNTAVTLNTLANDHAGNPGGSLVPATVTVTINPSNGIASVNPATGEITYTPNNGFTGVDTLTYSVCDNSTPSLCATSIQIITVSPVGCANSTVAADDYSYTPFNTPVNGNAILNDSDPEGDTQTITAQTTTVPSAGTLVLNSDGTYTFTPVAGFSGPVEFPYTVCDNGTPQACTNATIHILVAPPVQIPNPDFNVTYVNVTVTGNVSTNDHVEVGSTYGTPTAVPGNPGPAVPVMNADGTYSFISAIAGVFLFDVPVCAPAQVAPCPPVLLTITVLDNTVTTNPPVANVDIATTHINTPVTLNTLVNDQVGNPGGALIPASVTVTINPSNGIASVNPATGEITYTPNNGFTGVDTLTYSVCDNNVPSQCATAIQIITVLPAISANTTVAADDYMSTPFETAVNGNVILNDSDPEGDSQVITPQNTTVPGSGTLVLNSDGTYTFTPATGFTGPVEFPYTVCDNGTPQACANATLHILVGPVNVVPLTLLSFNANYASGKVKLTWNVTNESGVDRHFIERSLNGSGYVSIGSVSAHNTGLNDSYNYFDGLAGVRSNVLYYRLRSSDISGVQKLSNVAIVRLGIDGQLIISPNPATDNVQLSFYNTSKEAGSIALYGSNGQLVYQQSFIPQSSGNQIVSISNLARFQTGIYILKVKLGTEVYSEKIVIKH